MISGADIFKILGEKFAAVANEAKEKQTRIINIIFFISLNLF